MQWWSGWDWQRWRVQTISGLSPLNVALCRPLQQVPCVFSPQDDRERLEILSDLEFLSSELIAKNKLVFGKRKHSLLLGQSASF